jgi:hypothetical protein
MWLRCSAVPCLLLDLIEIPCNISAYNSVDLWRDYENRFREGRTSFTAVSDIQCTHVPLNGIMTFWNYGTPEYNLRSASNLQPCCKYRNGNTTKPHPNFRIKRFTVERDFHLLLEVTRNLVTLCSWEQRAGVGIVVDMETSLWELSMKWQHECETCCVCVWPQLMVPRLFLNYKRTSRALSSRKLMNSAGTTDNETKCSDLALYSCITIIDNSTGGMFRHGLIKPQSGMAQKGV